MRCNNVNLHRRVRRSRRSGLGMVELLVALSISALLLTGVAVAFVSAGKAVQINDEFTRATQSGRISINQIMMLARQCQTGTVTSTSLELKMPDATRKLYALDAVKHELQVTLLTNNPVEVHTLARNVKDLSFLTDPTGSSISMTVTIEVGDNQIVLNGSALPRRLMKYQ
jgi:type II secretory pathway pseudopilin PulG